MLNIYVTHVPRWYTKCLKWVFYVGIKITSQNRSFLHYHTMIRYAINLTYTLLNNNNPVSPGKEPNCQYRKREGTMGKARRGIFTSSYGTVVLAFDYSLSQKCINKRKQNSDTKSIVAVSPPGSFISVAPPLPEISLEELHALRLLSSNRSGYSRILVGESKRLWPFPYFGYYTSKVLTFGSRGPCPFTPVVCRSR